jgi:small subunit ribosomal protein S6
MLLFRELPALSPRRPTRAAQAGEADSDHGKKEVFGNVTPYEVLLLLDPELPEERQEEIVKRTNDLVERSGGKWESADLWGRRKLAYEIDHKAEGVYHLLHFEAEPETLAEVSRVLRITDGVMRHMAVRQPTTRPTGPLPTMSEPSQDSETAPEPVPTREEQ